MKIALINMPFSDIQRPSIALAQLKTVINESFGDKVTVREFFLNLEMSVFLTPEVYEFISSSGVSNNTGFGDWFFRQEAFPELEDNTESYFERYQFQFGTEMLKIYNDIIRYKREETGAMLDQWIREYGLHQYDVVGFTSMFMQNVPSFALARRIKLANPSALVIMGGANCESPMGEEMVRNVPCVDYVFSGNALRSFPSFITNYLNGEIHKSESINGVFTRKNCSPEMERFDPLTGKIIAPVGEERPVNDVVYVDYDEFLEAYDNKLAGTWKKPYLLFETSRGCWWGAKAHCTFCGLNGANIGYRAIEPARALEYIQGLIDKYKNKVDHFSCVDNIIPKEYFADVFPRLKLPAHISIFYEVKADLTEEQMRVLANTHISVIQPGIEALDTSSLKLMRKGTTSFNNIRLLKQCLTYSINPLWNLLIGFPGEQEEVYSRYDRILPSLYHLPPPSGIFPVRFDRYSPYFTRAESYNLELKPVDYYSFIYPYSEDTLAVMAYYFTDRNYKAEYITLVAKWYERLNALISKWNLNWEDPAHIPQLSLVQEAAAYMVHDSRNGTLLTYPVSETGKAILDSLSVYKNKKAILDELAFYPAAEVESELEYLLAKELLFEERGSLLSLVMIADSLFHTATNEIPAEAAAV
jgi:ribosomal peptide maturation radical SAM protein 1